MNIKLLTLVIDLYRTVKDGEYFKAIELNEEITKILDTYKDAC
jgi:hypothetical protein